MDALSYLLGKKAGGGGGGTSDYTQLSNKPQINSVELNGNKTLANLGIQSEITNANKLDASLVDDSLSTNKFVTSTEKTTWNGKQNLLTAGTNITIDANNVISASGGSADFPYFISIDATSLSSSIPTYSLVGYTVNDATSKAVWQQAVDKVQYIYDTYGKYYNVIFSLNFSTTSSGGYYNSQFYKQLFHVKGVKTSSGKITNLNLTAISLVAPGDYKVNQTGLRIGTVEILCSAGSVDSITYLGYNIENQSNKVSQITSTSTDTEYPSAKCVYDLVGNINTVLASLTTPSNNGGGE